MAAASLEELYAEAAAGGQGDYGADALVACDRLEKETPVKFDRSKLEVFVNDRLLAPNDEDTWKSLEPELKKYFNGAKIERHGEPRDLFRVAVQT